MSSATPILLERDNVNDEFVFLSRWIATHGQWVEEGAVIAEVETSKANVEVVAPRAGYLEQGFVESAELPYDSALGRILDEPVDPDGPRVPLSNASAAVSAAAPIPVSSPKTSAPAPAISRVEFTTSAQHAQRFSRRAEELIQQNGISKERFQGLRMVRALDVLRLLGDPTDHSDFARVPKAASTANGMARAPQAAPRGTHTAVPLSKMKRAEAQALATGTRNAIPSAVTVTCLTRGLRAALQRNPVVAGNPGAIILFEVARLLRRYPAFNATYRQDTMMQYQAINIGYAMDDGRGLKVAVLQDCDTKSLAQISEELRGLMLAYLDNKLTPAQVTGGTFTITDLSGLGVANFLPLISEDQGSILGIGGEQYFPGSRDGCYSLTLAFDHQLSEGRTAALFLNELKDRLAHYEAAMSDVLRSEIACARCGRKAAELPGDKGFLVQSIVPAGYLCNLCVAGL